MWYYKSSGLEVGPPRQTKSRVMLTATREPFKVVYNFQVFLSRLCVFPSTSGLVALSRTKNRNCGVHLPLNKELFALPAVLLCLDAHLPWWQVVSNRGWAWNYMFTFSDSGPKTPALKIFRILTFFWQRAPQFLFESCCSPKKNCCNQQFPLQKIIGTMIKVKFRSFRKAFFRTRPAKDDRRKFRSVISEKMDTWKAAQKSQVRKRNQQSEEIRYRRAKCQASRESLCFQWFGGLGASKSRFAKTADAESWGQGRNEKLL